MAEEKKAKPKAKRISAKEKERYARILAGLKAAYPEAKAELDFVNSYQLMVATILSAQCTDKQVNKATPALFAAYPDVPSMAAAQPDDIAPFVKSCGFWQTKSKNIVLACQRIMDAYGGEVPADLDALQTLPGVGRKTANVVASNAFGIPAIAVDTHVFRVANRLGLAHATTVEKTEEQLQQAIPRDDWSQAHHWLIFHGRRVCAARNPKCELCTVRDDCEYYRKPKKAKPPAKKTTK